MCQLKLQWRHVRIILAALEEFQFALDGYNEDNADDITGAEISELMRCLREMPIPQEKDKPADPLKWEPRSN